MCKVKCQDCLLSDSDKVCQYFRDAHRCDIDDKIKPPNDYCYRFIPID